LTDLRQEAIIRGGVQLNATSYRCDARKGQDLSLRAVRLVVITNWRNSTVCEHGDEMSYVRPRLNDHHGLLFTQEEVDFAIPFVSEDIPLFVDPFLLWKSPSLQDNSLHTALTNCFNHLGILCRRNRSEEAIRLLVAVSECAEVGLGDSAKRRGKPIGRSVAESILQLFREIPQIGEAGFVHFETIQLYVDQVAEDRISDLACSFAKSFLVDYTIEQCDRHAIPRADTRLTVYDYRQHRLVEERVSVPVCPGSGAPILLVPKRWLRFIPWINYEDYFDGYFAKEVVPLGGVPTARIAVLNYNRQNYDVVANYVRRKEMQRADCRNDPLFKAIPVLSAARRLKAIRRLPAGKDNNADKDYETHTCALLASLLYPELDFAQSQSRTDSGTLIRDLIFYNNTSHEFLRQILDSFGSRQLVFELKNVGTVEREHINQLNRYLNDTFGRFGVIVTRRPPPRNIFQNTIDLWAGQRRCILILDEDDLTLMCQLYANKQRAPIDVLKRKYVEFTRACPG
jgi:hypothetical protein